ncbi:tetratricopeptide repeat domain protein [Nitrospira sp. KM1]|uniref:tetratricopeptide repeat protein n=1 Tax=Nitrospira sp. KM1 TaxID=1936990 RepID=UPI0013A72038|nr:tetratricopeptide repeat protein [Nitrospira sp. KM1]BCA56222.1 tetratricopeptide repeat domain protein [Nitrospira sp. KM1]
MLRLLSTIFLISTGIFIYSYFRELNPGTITVHAGPSTHFELSSVTLVVFSMAVGAVFVALAVGFRQTVHVIGNWRSTRLQRRKEKVDALHREGTHAFMSKRIGEAVSLFEKALAIDPNRVDSLLWLGNIYRSESNFSEAIRLHQHANRIDDRSIEILLELAKDLESAKRYEDSLQALQKILKIEPDNLTALIRKRDLSIRLEKWSEALEIQHRLLKVNLPESERRIEAHLLTGCMYEVGRQLLERGHPDKARRYFRGAIKKDRTFLPAYIGLGEILIREGKTKEAVEILKKVYARTRNVILLHRLEELFLEQGEPSEIIRTYQEALEQDPDNPMLRFYLGKLYYRLEMVDEAFDILSTIEGPQDQLVDYHKIMANLFLRKQHMEQAVIELKRALQFKKRVVVPYVCTACQQDTAEWAGRCRRCGSWNTLVALPKLDSVQSVSEQESGPLPVRSVPYQGIASPFETV